MKTFKNKIATPLLTGLALSIACMAANAADFSQRTALAERSLKSGLGVDSAPLLTRAPGPGQRVATELFVKEFSLSDDGITTKGLVKTEVGKDKTTVIGDKWAMQIYGDGTKVKYRNYEFLDSADNKPVGVASRLSQDALEKLGREFIGRRLVQFVKLSKNETLVPWFTEFQVQGGGSIEAGVRPVAETVLASTVIFTKAVNGIPVLGPGSKVAVVFDNNGQAAGFDMDWSAYQVTSSIQKVASLSEVQGRANKLSPFDLGASDTKITRFECGYFDLGARKRDVNAPIQTACLVHANKRQIVDKVAYAEDKNSGHTVAAVMSPIPAGLNIARDANWPQAIQLLGGTPPNSDVPPSSKR